MPMLIGVTEVRVGIPYPLAGIEVVRAELSPPVAREFVLFGQNVDAEAALRHRVVDALVDPAELEAAALKKAAEMAALPLNGFAKIKRQLRAQALERMRAVVTGDDPFAGNWLSDETKAAAAAILAGGRG